MKIKYVNPNLDLSKEVAIVGSSGNLIDRNYGDIIDQYSDVIRFNRAPVDGYEPIVGSKTTLRVANVHVFRNIPISSAFTAQPADFIKRLNNNRILYTGSVEIKQNDKTKYTDASNELFIFQHGMLGKLKRSVGFNKGNPSVGAIMISLCIVSGVNPDLFGFDMDESDGSRTHYWEERPGPGPCHKVNYEKRFMQSLERAGKIKAFK